MLKTLANAGRDNSAYIGSGRVPHTCSALPGTLSHTFITPVTHTFLTTPHTLLKTLMEANSTDTVCT